MSTSKSILDVIEESVVEYIYEEIAAAYKVENKSNRFEIIKRQKVGNRKFKPQSPIQKINILGNGTELPFLLFNDVKNGERQNEYHIRYAKDTKYDINVFLSISDLMYSLSTGYREDKGEVYKKLYLNNTIGFKSLIESLFYYRVALLLETKIKTSGYFQLANDFLICATFLEGLKTVNAQFLQFCQNTLNTSFSELLTELNFDLTNFPILLAVDEFDEKTQIPLINFRGILSGTIKKDSILQLINSELLENKNNWFELYDAFMHPPIFYYEVLGYIGDEVLANSEVVNTTFWVEAVKRIIDTMVNYQWFGARYYEVSEEEFAQFCNIEILDSTNVYYDYDYCNLGLVVELLRQPQTYNGNKKNWFEVLEYFGNKYLENTPKEVNVEEYAFGLAKEGFLSSEDQKLVLELCKKYFTWVPEKVSTNG